MGAAVKKHVVLNGEAIFDLVEHDAELEEFMGVANLLAHELGHVQISY